MMKKIKSILMALALAVAGSAITVLGAQPAEASTPTYVPGKPPSCNISVWQGKAPNGLGTTWYGSMSCRYGPTKSGYRKHRYFKPRLGCLVWGWLPSHSTAPKAKLPGSSVTHCPYFSSKPYFAGAYFYR